MGAGIWYSESDAAGSIATIHETLVRGVNVIDTGDFYGMGKNELLVGQALKGRRDKALLSVKFGALRGPDGEFLGRDARPAATKNFLAHSRSRRGVHSINIYRPARRVVMGKGLVPSEPNNTDTISAWIFDPQTAIRIIPAWSSVFCRMGRLSLGEAHG